MQATPVQARRRASTFRRFGWLVVAAMALSAVAFPAVTSAQTQPALQTHPDCDHQDGASVFNGEGNGGNENCPTPTPVPTATPTPDCKDEHHDGHDCATATPVPTATPTPGCEELKNCATPTPVVTPTPPETPIATATPVPTATPSGEVEGATATPAGGVQGATSEPAVTPPPTATLPITGTPSGDTWRIALLAIAALLASILLFTPSSPVRSRRRR
jgi:hypothetical protein